MDPSGIFFTRYEQDSAIVRTRAQWLALAAFAAALIAFPWFASPRLVAVANLMFITAIVVVGLQITTGYAGQINLGQAAFMGVGAYGTSVMEVKFGLPFWVAVPMGGLIAASVGWAFGLTASRIKGFYLALTTIAAQFLFVFVVLNLPSSWLGGVNGFSLQPARMGGIVFDTDRALYLLFLVAAAVMVAGAFGILRSRHGRAFEAVRDDDVAAGMMGIDVAGTKARAFVLGAFYAGIGGGLWAYQIRFVSVDQFTLFNSIWFIAMMIVGGIGSIVGALIGTVVIRAVQETITSVGPDLIERFPALGSDVVFASMNVFLGLVITGFLLLEPKGLMHRWNIFKATYRLWPFPH
ncbi:branched-chain amino acid ABC transporter permease [Schlegelella sp. ID0723]|jgi:branched-chain amino acid transport system permease protein|uniref:Branched-chain amino acid ABC transporter permease n=1 Tax=Piscinibacter koreensis TaxID=2742824 RepID=A0A7Y6NSZ5_9BURK|nr:branched-chain amino acid ABC transporter permease [Schlegelella koreensis]NUZ08787.1 branched-chain amino acid ABC transporter permease [Schlegelella koreensis]